MCMDLLHKVGEQGGYVQVDSEPRAVEDDLIAWAHHTYVDAEAHHNTSA